MAWSIANGALKSGLELTMFLVCPPCAKARGLGEDDLIEAAIIQGSGGMHERILKGHQVLSF